MVKTRVEDSLQSFKNIWSTLLISNYFKILQRFLHLYSQECSVIMRLARKVFTFRRDVLSSVHGYVLWLISFCD